MTHALALWLDIDLTVIAAGALAYLIGFGRGRPVA